MRLSQRPRLTWLLAVVLVTALVFAACAPRVRQPGGNSGSYNGNTTTATTTTSTGSSSSAAQNPNVQAVQNADQSVQSALQSLQSAQNDANTNYSSQDTQTVP